MLKLTMILAAAIPLLAQSLAQSHVTLQRAIRKETVEGDLNGAIALYRKAAAEAGKDRSTAAQALLHLAQCYEKQGDAEAKKVYERVVREFADQKEAVTMARARLGARTPNSGSIARQVWAGPKVDASGTVSADGRMSYTDWETGDLAIHDLMTGNDLRLTNKGERETSPEYAAGSAISRDGKQVAYGWRAPNTNPSQEERFEVRMIDVVGGKPRILTSQPDIGFAAVSDWSPDGKWLAVRLGRADGSTQIALVSTADGAVRVLKTTDWRGPSKVAFSPDGKYLAYDLPVADNAEQRDVYVLAADGSRETPIVAHPANDRLLGWSPDGKYLLFASDRSGSPGLWAMSIADGKPQGAPELVKANVDPAPLGFTKSGAFYYRVLTGGRDIFVSSVDFEAGKVLAPSSVIPQPYQGLIDSPRWSPDGKFLAYFTSKGGSAGNRLTGLAIRSMETGKVRELRPDLATLNGSPHSRPRWSPDANSFFVAGTDRKGCYGIYRIDAQTGHSTPVVMNSGQDYPIARDLSPDGRMLVISRMAPNAIVVSVRDLQTGSERELVRRWRMGEVALSPDGRFVALTAFDERVRPSPLTSSLLVIPVEGGEPRVLLRVTSPAEWLGALVAWSPDGKSLFFRKFLDGSTRGEVSRIPVEGGVPCELGLHFEVGRSPHIHPDGRQVAFTTIGDPKYEVWNLENFLSALGANK